MRYWSILGPEYVAGTITQIIADKMTIEVDTANGVVLEEIGAVSEMVFDRPDIDEFTIGRRVALQWMLEEETADTGRYLK